ncbi:MAG: hypothetical protein Q7R99_00550 [bacterium]|nr:hypothetical protein [bacterium]
MSNHSCNYLLFRCMDFRLKPSVLNELLEVIGCSEGNFDLVSVAGSAKDLLSERQGEKEFLLKQIELSSKLHHICKVIVLLHDNCGAYGIADKDEEEETQKQDLAKIEKIIKNNFKDIEFDGFIVKNTSTGDLTLKKV